MSAKTYLQKIKHDREYIRQLRARRDNLHLNYSGISGIDYSRDKVQGSPTNALEERAWDLLERMESINNEILTLSLDVDRKLEEIHNINNDLYAQILYMHYSEYKSFEQIAVDLNYDYHYVCQLHGEALKLFSSKVKTT